MNVLETLCKADFGDTTLGLIPQFLQLCGDSIAELRRIVIAETPGHGLGASSLSLKM